MTPSDSFDRLETLGRRFQRTRRLALPGLTFERYLKRPEHYDACYSDVLAAWQGVDPFAVVIDSCQLPSHVLADVSLN